VNNNQKVEFYTFTTGTVGQQKAKKEIDEELKNWNIKMIKQSMNKDESVLLTILYVKKS
jgi:hypothetical protein